MTPEQYEQIQQNAHCLYDQATVEAALDQMAQTITQQLSNTTPLFLCVLSGAIIPTGCLLKRLNFPLELNYIHASRYQGKTTGSQLIWKAKPTVDLKNRTIVLVDDILDGGVTLAALIDYCREEGAKKVYTAVLLDKQRPREPGGLEKADFTGLTTTTTDYLFGYGMDYHEYFRNVSGVFGVEPNIQ